MSGDSTLRGRRVGLPAVILAVAAVGLLLAVRIANPPTLEGRWRDQSAAGLLYEFRADGSVWLLDDGRSLPVFRYEVIGRDGLRLHDGMGRPRELTFTLDGDVLTLRDAAGPATAGVWRRERP